MKKSNTKKKQQQRDFNGKRDRALELHPASRKDLRTIEAIRAFTADLLKDCKAKPLNAYDAGFQGALEEIGRMLDPGGYSCARTMTRLIAALQKAAPVKSKAEFQSVEAIRDYLEKFFASVIKYPSDSLYLYGFEDASWRMWRMVTGGNMAPRKV